MAKAMEALRNALQQLEQEKADVDQQIAVIQSLLGHDDRTRGRAVVSIKKKVPRRRMSAAARKLISQRMKAAWAKRKAAAQSKGARKSGR